MPAIHSIFLTYCLLVKLHSMVTRQLHISNNLVGLALPLMLYHNSLWEEIFGASILHIKHGILGNEIKAEFHPGFNSNAVTKF